MKPGYVREHILHKEAVCPDCGLLPAAGFLDLVEKLRLVCGFALPIQSMARCERHNREIGGAEHSAHLLHEGSYGAADIGIRNTRRRFFILWYALMLGFNNIEVCDGHLHVGRVPEDHPGFGRLVWGKSK